jgi:cytochrome c-type biogenesis protein CcmH/NrfF
MNVILGIVAVIAIIFFIIGGMVKAMGFLLWIAPILLVLAIIVFLFRIMSGRRRV